MIPIQTTYLRPRSGFILFALLPLVVYAYVATKVNPDETLMMVMFCFFLLLPVGMYIFSVNSYVQVDNEGILHKNPFREKRVQWKDVTRSYFRIRHTGKSSQRLWYFENITGKVINFSTGMYSRKSLQTIAEVLVTRCPNAEIDQKIKNIAEGKFPWYIF